MIYYGRGAVCEIMVKIQTRIVRKKYKKSQPAYEYKQHLIAFPLSKNEEIASFLNQQLNFELEIKDDTMNLKLKKQKSNELQNGKK
jgi:hypothetical protein